jgi:hypothetical protein
MDEGVLHIIVVPELTNQFAGELATQMLPFSRISGGMRQWTTTSFAVTDPSGPVLAGIDGENVQLESPVRIEVMAQALRLFVPFGGRQRRAVKPVSKAGAKALLDILTGKA